MHTDAPKRVAEDVSTFSIIAPSVLVPHRHGGSALIGKDRLQQLATLKDDKKGGVYALCRAADSSANDPKTVLYYTETSMSQPVLIQDESVVERARKALLDWHKADDNCTPGNWDLCEEAQEMLAQS